MTGRDHGAAPFARIGDGLRSVQDDLGELWTRHDERGDAWNAHCSRLAARVSDALRAAADSYWAVRHGIREGAGGPGVDDGLPGPVLLPTGPHRTPFGGLEFRLAALHNEAVATGRGDGPGAVHCTSLTRKIKRAVEAAAAAERDLGGGETAS